MPTPSDELKELEARAREHKRALAFHRRQLRSAKQQLTELRQRCAQFGIKLEEAPLTGVEKKE